MSASSSRIKRFGTTGIKNVSNNSFFVAPMQILYSIIPFRTGLLNKTLQLASNDVNDDKDVDGVIFSKQDIVKAKLAVEELQGWFVGMSGTSNVYVPTIYLPGMVSYEAGNTRNGVFPEWKDGDPFYFQSIPIPNEPPPSFAELYGLDKGHTCDVKDSFDCMMRWIALAQVNREDLLDIFQIWRLPNVGDALPRRVFYEVGFGDSFSAGLEFMFSDGHITHLPPVFVFSSESQQTEIVEELNLPLVETEHLESRKYVLHALVEFVSGGVGRCIACIKNHRENEWYRFDGSIVGRVSRLELQGYIAMYVYIQQDRLHEMAV
ncbi:hypothetical protein INT47_011818 [Mucor saturninus]|uniref:USP domain-containing protein n=1 Tax=Mucor saturninus TaxID=64648 RepID=A0A8H7V8V6_9FUNG|nr:hypothetical protein INT47_011818 [Mucor saturninus]